MTERIRRVMQANAGYSITKGKIVFCDVEVVINLDMLVDHLGVKARQAKSKRSCLIGNAIVVKYLKDL